MNRLFAFICFSVVTFIGGSQLVAQTITFNVSPEFQEPVEFNGSADLTSSGVTIVDSSTATESVNIVDPSLQPILEVFFSANVSSSGSVINSDGTIGNFGTGSPFNNELELSLISPSGTNLELIGAGTFQTGDNDDAVELLDINFADGGAIQGINPVAGTFAPTGGTFDIFNGELATGAWQVVIEDTVGADPKSLNGYSLTVVTGATAVPEPGSVSLMALSLIGVECAMAEETGAVQLIFE